MLRRPRIPLALAALLAASAAGADDAPRERLLFNGLVVGRYFPIGADLQGTVLYERKIGDSPELLFATRHWNVSSTATINPAEWSVNVAAQVEPIAVFQLKAIAEYRGYFGGFNSLLSWNHLDPEFDDGAIAAAGSRGENYATWRTSVRLEPKLRAKVGPIGVQNTFGVTYGYVAARAGDALYYNPGQDLLMPTNGLTLSNQLSVVYLAGALTAGALHEYYAPLGIGPRSQVHRVGAIFAYTFFDDRRALVNKPSLFALALWNVVHQERAGLMPTVIVGVSTETDLLAQRATGPR